MKKWAKKNQEGWGAQLVAAANAGLDLVGGAGVGDGEDEVVFEWVRMRVAQGGGKAGSNILRRYSTAGTGATRSRPNSMLGQHVIDGNTLNPVLNPSPTRSNTSLGPVIPPSVPRRSTSPAIPSGLDSRPEPVRRVSASASSSHPNSQSRPGSTTPSPEIETASLAPTVEEAHTEEDSDPEDSETPWTCSIWVKKTGHRQILGTLTPALYHPKVIATLKMPAKVEGVCLRDISVRTKDGSAGEGIDKRRREMMERVKGEVALSEENLKDVVCVTALWLVAREEFGGLGRKKKA